MVVDDDFDWVAALDAGDERQAAALLALRDVLLKGLRKAFQQRTDVSEAQLEDFAQEALVRTLERRGQFLGNSRFTTWAYVIAVNVAYAELRRKRWKDISLDALTSESTHLGEALSHSYVDTEQHTEQRRVIAVLHRAIDESLTERQRTAILGRLKGLPIAQIVSSLGITPNAMYKLFHDARLALKGRLLAEGISPDRVREAFKP